MQPASLDSANAISLLKTLGIRLVEIGDRHAVMTVEADSRHLNYLGGVHGGLIAALADIASDHVGRSRRKHDQWRAGRKRRAGEQHRQGGLNSPVAAADHDQAQALTGEIGQGVVDLPGGPHLSHQDMGTAADGARQGLGSPTVAAAQRVVQDSDPYPLGDCRYCHRCGAGIRLQPYSSSAALPAGEDPGRPGVHVPGGIRLGQP
jgi:hypothetical protein